MKDKRKSDVLFEMKTFSKQELFLLISSLLLTFAHSSPESSEYSSNINDQKILNRSELFKELEGNTFSSISEDAENQGNQKKICVTRLSNTGSEFGDTTTASDLVTKQYEALPYPEVKEIQILTEKNYYEKENKKPFMIIPTTQLEHMNHYLYKGNENFRNYFRHLVAGGGTGTGTVFTAEQLNHTNAEIVYLDFSSASTKIAQSRAVFRNLRNIIWIHSWIEDIRYLGMGIFNDLQCTGVLHHLKEPSFGLNVLKDALVENGKLDIMVYAKYGRTAIYQIQHLMKLINSYTKSDIEIELENTKHALASLPNHHWFIINNFVNDHKSGNIGIYDLLLHKRDISFSLESLFKWMENSGLHYVEIDDCFQRYFLKPQHIFQDDLTRRIISRLSISKAFHVTEIIAGKIIKQTFYASKSYENIASIDDTSNIIYINGNAIGLRDVIDKKKNYKVLGNQTFFQAKLSERSIIQYQTDTCEPPVRAARGPVVIRFRSNDFTEFFLRRLLRFKSGIKIKDILSDYKKISKLASDEEIKTLLDEFYTSIKDSDVFMLKKDHIKDFPKTHSYLCFKVKSA